MIEDGWYIAFLTGQYEGGRTRMFLYLDGTFIRSSSHSRLADAKNAARRYLKHELSLVRSMAVPGGVNREDYVTAQPSSKESLWDLLN